MSSATRAKQPNFNAINKEEPRCIPPHRPQYPRTPLPLLSSSHAPPCSRYSNVTSCSYIVDLDAPWQAEERYALRPDFDVMVSLPFLRASATPALLRWLWMPKRAAGAAVFDSYVLLSKKGNASSAGQ